MKFLGLDVGERRTGVALSDPEGILAMPLTTIGRGSVPDDVEAVVRLAEEHDVEEIVVGLPLTLSGRIGGQARSVGEFAKSLSARAAVPVRTVDERYSTAQAERLMRQAGAAPSRNRARVDAAAAVVILQSYLDSKRTAPDL